MKSHWIAAIAIASIGVGVNAQQQTTAPTGTPAAIDRGGNQTVHITGCVARADAGGTATPAQGTAAHAFMLTGARMSNDSPTGTAAPTAEDSRTTPNAPQSAQSPAAAPQAAAGQASPAGAAAAARPGMRYVLKSTNADLTPHVGHQVEITGRFDATVTYPHGVVVGTSGSTAAATAPSSNPTSSTATGSAPASVSTPPTVDVESVRMISGTCAAGQ